MSDFITAQTVGQSPAYGRILVQQLLSFILTKKKPFEALYGYPPPQISEYVIHDNEAKELLTDRQQLLSTLKQNLHKAQQRMKKFADRKRVERSFQVGVWFI